MSRAAAATLVLGFTVGIVGVMLYTRYRSTCDHEEAEKLLDRLSTQLLVLESAKAETG